jgi:hypothetical protein
MWITDREEVPTRPTRTIGGSIRMPTVFWSPLDFAVVEILTKQGHFDTNY